MTENHNQCGRCRQGVLLPIAGPKGYGLSLFIEIFAGVLSGSAFGGDLGPGHGKAKSEKAADISHFFLLVDVARFMPTSDFTARMDKLITDVKPCRKWKGLRNLSSGEIEQRKAEQNRRDGLALDESLQNDLKKMCARLGLNILCEPTG